MIVNQGQKIRRMARPSWDRERCLVRIDYDLEVTELVTGARIVLGEQHLMRYLFLDQLRCRLARFGLEVVQFGEWPSNTLPFEMTFGAYLVAIDGR